MRTAQLCWNCCTKHLETYWWAYSSAPLRNLTEWPKYTQTVHLTGKVEKGTGTQSVGCHWTGAAVGCRERLGKAPELTVVWIQWLLAEACPGNIPSLYSLGRAIDQLWPNSGRSSVLFTPYNPLHCSQPTGKEAGQWFKAAVYPGMDALWEAPREGPSINPLSCSGRSDSKWPKASQFRLVKLLELWLWKRDRLWIKGLRKVLF